MLWHLHYWPRTYIQVGCMAFVIAAVGMPIAVFLFRRLGIVDKVARDKFHKKPVARGGGVVIFFAFALAVVYPFYFSYPMKGVVIGAFICLIVGALDDLLGGVPAVWKVLTLIVVTVVLSQYGVLLNVFQFYPLDLLFTVLWIVGVTSAFNGIDNMDGLASGIAIIVCAMFLTIAVQAFLAAGTETSLSWFGLLAAGLIGANLGFLAFNFKPAWIFMGDSGSFFMGFTLAALGVMGEWTENPLISCTIPVLILGVPIADFAYIVISRILRGETRTLRQVVEHCGTDHLSHRLVWIGFSERQAVLMLYLVSIAMGVTGVLLRNSTSLLDSVLGLVQGFAMVAVVIVLMTAAARRYAKGTVGNSDPR